MGRYRKAKRVGKFNKMKMKNLLVSFICLTSFFLNSQIWGPATPFPGASGYINDCTNNNQTFINAMCVFNNELFVGGNFSAIGGIVANGIAKWNGNSWSSVGAGNFLNSCVSDIIVYNSNLYFTADKLYKWDGTSIQEFTYLNSAQNTVPVYGQDLHVFNGELYISTGSSTLIKYNGSSFTQLVLNSSAVTVGSLRCIDDYNNTLYIGTTKGLFKNQNGNWIDCNGITTVTPEVYDIETYNNELYVLGYFSSIGGLSVNNFAKYNGSTWSNIILPENNYPSAYLLSGWNLGTNHLKTMNNELYFAHTFATNQQQTFIASPLIKFNGSQWSQISQNSSLGGGCSIIYNNELYCGGKFYVFSGGVTIDYLAKLQGSASIDEKQNLQIQISPNPTKDFVSIKVEKNMNQSFQIFDQMGREVFKGKLIGQETEVNLSSLAKGIYTLKIEGNYQPAQIVKE